ncbi:hypothetical protein CVD25_10640 [Bacillus canaveralius]|uniref:DUF4097 domain-containing protein n=1 Tax=Bacillus canaveralius TaxID=1403243 RepID=A0A2N5GM69_9BACI|nr:MULTISPECIES: DUF4097 family beta strand repeat-containing protein [Bacillus]PLR82914.1 hypothetical protein CU635_10555 [Bacillus canaveralius]PLR85285.1 hypothetical protein CVD23_10070 [Bacillus sp. V33-4]PLR97081.1 hypothetical protein CVD25_10640 [Bacillus canaveralius]RSK55518.1 hypothetical protein EJA13_03525 [Bacillus canaveralius]
MKRILIIFCIILGVYLLFFSSFNISSLLTGKDEQQARVTDNIDLIEIDVSSLDAVVIPEERDNVKAVLDGKGKVTVKERGDKITVDYDRKWYQGFGFFNTPTLAVYIPENYKEDMNIDIGSGTFNYDGGSAGNPAKLNHLSLHMGSGDVNIMNLDVKEYVQDVGSGSVVIETLTAEKGVFNVSSGDTMLSNYSGQLNADVSSGELIVQMAKLNDAINIDVSSGDVSLDLPADADFSLKGQVSSGDIYSDFDLKNQNTSKKLMEGTYGSGKHEINLNVSSGQINVF